MFWVQPVQCCRCAKCFLSYAASRFCCYPQNLCVNKTSHWVWHKARFSYKTGPFEVWPSFHTKLATNSEQHTGHFADTLKAKKFLALPHPWGSKCLQLSAFLTCSYLTFQHCNLCFVPTVSNVWSSTQGNKVHTLSRKTEISTRQQTPACRWRCCDCYLYDLFYSSSTFWTSFHGSLIFKNYVKKSLF